MIRKVYFIIIWDIDISLCQGIKQLVTEFKVAYEVMHYLYNDEGKFFQRTVLPAGKINLLFEGKGQWVDQISVPAC